MNADWFIDRLLILVPLWLSLSVHEWAHARMAWHLGDDTAKQAGRLTLNPLAHIDLVGTLVLPLLGVPFGWAKPVPVEPTRFRTRWSMQTGMLLAAIAGPLANLVLALICIVLLAVMLRLWPVFLFDHGEVFTLLRSLIFLNVVLAAFNALPIPPLDGSRVADAIMPKALRPAWEACGRFGPLTLLAVLFLPSMLKVNLFLWPLELTRDVVHSLVALLGG